MQTTMGLSIPQQKQKTRFYFEWRWECVRYTEVPDHLSLQKWKDLYSKVDVVQKTPPPHPLECQDGIAHVPVLSRAFPQGFCLNEHVTIAHAKKSFPGLTDDPCFILPSKTSQIPKNSITSPFDHPDATLRLSGYLTRANAEVPFSSFTVARLSTVASSVTEQIMDLWAGCYINASRNMWILRQDSMPVPTRATVSNPLSGTVYANTAYTKPRAGTMTTVTSPQGFVMPYVSVVFPTHTSLPLTDWWSNPPTSAQTPIKLKCSWFGGYPSVPDGRLQRALLVHQMCMEVAVANTGIPDGKLQFDMICTDYRTGDVFALNSASTLAQQLTCCVWAEETPYKLPHRRFVCAPCAIVLGTQPITVKPYHNAIVVGNIGTMIKPKTDSGKWALDASGQAAGVPVSDWTLETHVQNLSYDPTDNILKMNGIDITAVLDGHVPRVSMGQVVFNTMVPCLSHALGVGELSINCNVNGKASAMQVSSPQVSVVRSSAQGVVLRITSSETQSDFPVLIIGTNQDGSSSHGSLSELLTPVKGCGAVYYHGGEVKAVVRLAYARTAVDTLSALSRDSGGVFAALSLIFVITVVVAITALRPRTKA